MSEKGGFADEGGFCFENFNVGFRVIVETNYLYQCRESIDLNRCYKIKIADV